MKTMCPPGYHHNGSVATHALGHIMYGYIYIYIYGIYIIFESCFQLKFKIFESCLHT